VITDRVGDRVARGFPVGPAPSCRKRYRPGTAAAEKQGVGRAVRKQLGGDPTLAKKNGRPDKSARRPRLDNRAAPREQGRRVAASAGRSRWCLGATIALLGCMFPEEQPNEAHHPFPPGSVRLHWVCCSWHEDSCGCVIRWLHPLASGCSQFDPRLRKVRCRVPGCSDAGPSYPQLGEGACIRGYTCRIRNLGLGA